MEKTQFAKQFLSFAWTNGVFGSVVIRMLAQSIYERCGTSFENDNNNSNYGPNEVRSTTFEQSTHSSTHGAVDQEKESIKNVDVNVTVENKRIIIVMMKRSAFHACKLVYAWRLFSHFVYIIKFIDNSMLFFISWFFFLNAFCYTYYVLRSSSVVKSFISGWVFYSRRRKNERDKKWKEAKKNRILN